MDLKDLSLAVGKWVVANCERFTDEKSCTLMIIAPEDQQSERVETASARAVKSHGLESTRGLRGELIILQVVEIS